MRPYHKRAAALPAALLALSLLLTGCGAAQPQGQSQDTALQRFSYTCWDVFDTVTSVVGYAESQEAWDAQMEALHADLLEYHRLYDIYNSYEGMTNLADINAGAGEGPVAADPRILEMLALAQQAGELTGGKLNVAAGTLLALWHDSREAAAADPEHAALPDPEALAEAAAHCGADGLLLDPEAGTVELTDPEQRLDVGSVGKGYAVEQCARAAEARGLTSASISVGGNVRTIGKKQDGSLWSTGIEDPWKAGTEQTYLLALETPGGKSVVTSGDYQRYFVVDGVRYAHLIDLETGYPAREFSSVTVLAEDSGLADCLSTGLFCMELEDGRALVEELEGVEACWMLPDGTVTYSGGFETYVRQ